MTQAHQEDVDLIMTLLAPLEPRDHEARLRRLLQMTAGALVSVAGERAAYEIVQRTADALPGTQA